MFCLLHFCYYYRQHYSKISMFLYFIRDFMSVFRIDSGDLNYWLKGGTNSFRRRVRNKGSRVLAEPSDLLPSTHVQLRRSDQERQYEGWWVWLCVRPRGPFIHEQCLATGGNKDPWEEVTEPQPMAHTETSVHWPPSEHKTLAGRHLVEYLLLGGLYYLWAKYKHKAP